MYAGTVVEIGADPRAVPSAEPRLHAGPHGLDAAGRWSECAPPDADRGHAAQPDRSRSRSARSCRAAASSVAACQVAGRRSRASSAPATGRPASPTSPAMSGLLEVEDLDVHYGRPGAAGTVKAVDGVSFSVERGRTLGLVGRSGCGKSTTGYAILQLVRPTSAACCSTAPISAGSTSRSLRRMRRKLQIIFQDSHASLNPRMPIGDLVGEALDIHGLFPAPARAGRIRELLGHGRPRRPSDRTLSARIERRPGAARRDLPRARRRARS